MNTNKYDITDENIKKCSEYIKEGKTVVFPTETVYGIGANALDKEAALNIFKAKNRPADNPLIVHISNKEMLKSLTSEITEVEEKLIETYFPGPFTIILKKSSIVPDIVTAGLDTVAVRMPDNKVAIKLIEYSNLPIAAPSANISSKPSGTNTKDIYEELNGKVRAILDGGNSKIGLESTVVKVIDNEVVILRPGYITKQNLIENGFKTRYDNKVLNNTINDNKVISPGMKYKHYSPNIDCILIKCNNLKESIEKVINKHEINKDDVCILTYDEYVKEIEYTKLSLGSYTNYSEVSSNIYSKLREVDKLNKKLCIIHSLPENDNTIAILNRLIKTCEHNIYNM